MPPTRNNPHAARHEAHAHGTTSHAPAQRLTFPRGPWILRSKAQQEFDLAPSDLDSILPIEVRPNPYGNPWPMKKYNWRDVRDLADRLRPTFNADDRAEEDGVQIERIDALSRGKLKDCQLDRVKPTAVEQATTCYNLKDVEEFEEKVRYAAAHPTGIERPAHLKDTDDFNIFDGIAEEDADDWIFRLTGIDPHAFLYCGLDDD